MFTSDNRLVRNHENLKIFKTNFTYIENVTSFDH